MSPLFLPERPSHFAHWDTQAVFPIGTSSSGRYVVGLNEAIFLAREALALYPPGHLIHLMCLNNLANYLSRRCNQLREVVDLNEAIVLGQETLALCLPGHPARSRRLDNLAASLFDGCEHLKVMADLNEAISLAQDALALYPPGRPEHSTCLDNLGVLLSDRYEQLKATEDIINAIALARGALALHPLGHPLRSSSLQGFASYLISRFMRSNQLKDKEELFDVYAQLSHIPPTVSSADLSAAGAWTSATEDFQHPTTLLAYETTLQFLIHHLATLPSLPQHLGILKKLTSSFAMDAFSSCLRNHSPIKLLSF